MWELSSYFGLFLAAFGAATLLPMQSEAVLVGLLLSDRYAAWTLLVVATTGNVLDSALNWLLGALSNTTSTNAGFSSAKTSWRRPSRLITASVAAAQLGADHWGSTHRRGWCHARALLELPFDRDIGQDLPLSGAGYPDAGWLV